MRRAAAAPALRRPLARRSAGVRPAPLLVALVAYAGVSEVLQAVLPIHRDGDVADAAVDALGAVLGVVLGVVLARRRR